MRPLYDARVSDLGTGDLVRVQCVCGHEELLTADQVRKAGTPAFGFIRDLKRRLRCRECDAKGRADVSIVWSDRG